MPNQMKSTFLLFSILMYFFEIDMVRHYYQAYASSVELMGIIPNFGKAKKLANSSK